MRNALKCLLPAFLAVLLLGACNPRRGTVQVRLVATAGMHGLVFADDPLTGNARDASASVLSGFLKQQRKAYDNLVYADCGDIIAGSAESFHDRTAVFEITDICAQTTNLLGCDAVVPGDRDLALGGESMYSFYSGSEALMLCANLGFDSCGDFFPPYVTIERNGMRISLIGFTDNRLRELVPPDMVDGMVFRSAVSEARSRLPEIMEKDNPDIVIGLLHGSIEEAEDLARSVPGFNLIVCSDAGDVPVSRLVNSNGDSVTVVSTGTDVRSAATATFTLDFTAGDRPAVSVTAERTDLAGLSPDPDFEQAMADRKRLLANNLDSVIGTLGMDLDFRGVYWRQTTGMDLAHRYLRRHYAAQISLAAVPAPGLFFPKGELKSRDAYAIFPAEEQIVSAMLRGTDIIAILEYSADCFYNTVTGPDDRLLKFEESHTGTVTLAAGPQQMITAAGINYTVNVTQPYGKRITVLSMADGKPFDRNAEYRTSMTAGMFCRGTSQLAAVPGLDMDRLSRGFNTSARADYRYGLISDMFVQTDTDTPLTVTGAGSWKLVPETLVSACLARDTLNIQVQNKKSY